MRERSDKLFGLVAVVTGGAGGIGAAICRRLAAAGATVAVFDLGGDALAELGRELGASAIPLPCDVTDADACARAVKEVRARAGRIDLVIAGAGITARSAFADTSLDVFRRVMEVNFFGALYVVKAALPELARRRGRVVVISSVAGLAPLYGRSAYAASKHALHGLFETARAELAGRGVSVSMVCPSFTRSRLETSALGPRGERIDRPRSSVGRTADPDEVAQGVIAAIGSRRRLTVMSPVGKLAALLSRIAPGVYERLMVQKLGSELREDAE